MEGQVFGLAVKTQAEKSASEDLGLQVQFSIWFQFPANLQAGRHQVVLESWPTTGEIWVKVLLTSLGLAQLWPLQALGEWHDRQELPLSVLLFN